MLAFIAYGMHVLVGVHSEFHKMGKILIAAEFVPPFAAAGTAA
jgi:hypothetical protein